MDEREYRQNRSGNNNNKSPGPIHDYEQYMYGGNVPRDRIEENSPNATIEELDEDDEQIFNLVGIDEKSDTSQPAQVAQAAQEQELTPEDERQINQVFQRGVPAAIVGTYGTTLGTKVIWQSFAKVIIQRFGVVAAQALGLSAADGLLPVGEAIALGLLAVTAWQIARDWDELWRDAEQILVGQEPEPQIYTTPDGETRTIENTGHAPPEVETGTPGYESPSVDVPPHTGHEELEQPSAEDFIMESQLDQDFKNPEVRRRDEIAHGGYYTRKNLRKKFQEAELSPRDKHISSTTVEEAERKSYNVAQYLPGINHGALERKAMLEGEYLMERPGDGYWNFYRSDDYVGYDKGVKTRWIRSEYSANTIHGHPMNPKRLSKYIKNPKP